MSLLTQLPHRCTIRRKTRTKGSLAGSKDTPVNEQTDAECWEQQATNKEIDMFQKRGMEVTRKVYFTTDPGVTSRHQIVMTQRNGIAVSGENPLDVVSEALPDASAGKSVLFKVMVKELTGEYN